MPGAARVGDMHTCPVASPNPHGGGPILPPGCPTVMINNMPAARATDLCTCAGPVDSILLGSKTVMIGGMPAARMMDQTVHGGMITLGSMNVMIGG